MISREEAPQRGPDPKGAPNSKQLRKKALILPPHPNSVWVLDPLPKWRGTGARAVLGWRPEVANRSGHLHPRGAARVVRPHPSKTRRRLPHTFFRDGLSHRWLNQNIQMTVLRSRGLCGKYSENPIKIRLTSYSHAIKLLLKRLRKVPREAGGRWRKLWRK